ncbi:hypothetical protein LOAG_05092 [Loa loa]|uniref:Uncharacterized protein n=1 Tax=Loa loa TaxID=7209 RepID=A0A1S0U2F1_LOALO|nr:hypothetical protein LOAG_05092 [Loa loa]EFO23391.1 hypothetical protein LOAG_05092 [Loa loa]
MWVFLYFLHCPAFGILHQCIAASVPRPCRLPPEYNQMPDFAREKLRSIWENYKSGKSCVAEQIATDVILTVVNIFPTKYRHAVSPARYNSHYEYNSASDHISPTPEDEAVYNEVPISETFELPEFLKGASKNIIDNFTKVWNDPNIPSEGLREEMIHLLAVSLLSTKELTAYNRYMKERRHCQQQLLLHIRQMSDEARKALNILAYIEPDERFGTVENFSPSIRRELKDFARRRAGKCI